MIFGIYRPFIGGKASRAPLAAAILAAFAILAPLPWRKPPQPATSKTAAPAHKHAAADPAPSAAPVKTIGNKNAPISMEVFSDYQCPSCGSFFENTLAPDDSRLRG